MDRPIEGSQEYGNLKFWPKQSSKSGEAQESEIWLNLNFTPKLDFLWCILLCSVTVRAPQKLSYNHIIKLQLIYIKLLLLLSDFPAS